MGTTHPPPRFILGTSLLFWGLMTDRLLIALILALLVESARWVKFRWDFNDDSRGLAWQLTSIIIIIGAVLIFLESGPYVALPNLLTWLPLLLVPMQLVQNFGLAPSMPLNTFSFLAKTRRRRNLRLGLTESVIFINFGNVYFVATLIASTLGSGANSPPLSMLFLPGLIVLTGWMSLAANRSGPIALLIALMVAGAISVGGQYGIEELQMRYGGGASGGSQFDPNSVWTMIGKSGTVNQPPDIAWRLKIPEHTPAPRLLRIASYNVFRLGRWTNLRHDKLEFKDLESLAIGEQSYSIVTSPDAHVPPARAVLPELPRFELRGSAAAESPLPLPGDTTSLTGFDLDGIERNTLGTVRVFPKHSVIVGTVLWKGENNPESAPIDEIDIQSTPLDREKVSAIREERETLQAVLREIKWEQLPSLPAKLEAMRNWFADNFQYSRTLKIESSSQVAQRPTAITQFLTKHRSGHCEYFATAAALLLREGGIPARYATGFAVFERGSKHGELVIRGTHGHAWCRVWDAGAGHWIDFDPTPSNWQTAVSNLNPSMQKFNDALRRMREDFFLWRNRPANRMATTILMSAICLAVISYILKRLWKSKQRLEREQRGNGYDGPAVRTPLHGLERAAEKILGPRRAGETFASWFRRLKGSLPQAAPIDEAVALHQQLRFDPQPAAPEQQQRLDKLASEIGAAIKKA